MESVTEVVLLPFSRCAYSGLFTDMHWCRFTAPEELLNSNNLDEERESGEGQVISSASDRVNDDR